MNVVERQGMIVHLNKVKQAKALRAYGSVHYVSRKMKYAIVYCDRAKYEETIEAVAQLPFVEKVERSQRPFVATTYENAHRDKAKEYDYKQYS